MPTSATADSKQIFLSYSRADVDYARALSAELAALGFSLWRDRADMEGGENWWQQIEAAIRGVDTVLLLLSESALASKVVSKEWRYARQVGTRVIPVLAQTIDPTHAPRWMSKRDWYDFRQRDQDPDQQLLWEKLLVQLRAQYQRQRAPFMAEDLPVDYVPRPVTLQQIITQIVDVTREEPQARVLALKGAGGYGKTTIARGVCADERVQAAYDEGVLWVTLGEKVENLTDKVDDLVYALSGRHTNANALETVTAEFADVLAERDVLLVIDDVWNAADLKPFLQGGPRCTRLITTRDAGTLPLSAVKIAVDEMAHPEAVALLQHGLPMDDPALPAAFEKLAERLGHWPLLIKLVNGSLRDAVLDFHQPLLAAIADMNQGLDEGGLTAFDTENTLDRHKAVGTTLELSLARLTPDERNRFSDLLIFPEDFDIPLEVVGRLWGLTSVFTRKLAGRLFNMSLLLAYNLESGTLRLHDIVRDYLTRPAAYQQGLASGVSSGSGSGVGQAEVTAHNKLLDSYRLAQWADLPATERYLWEYLGWHLMRAGRAQDFITTVTDLNYLAKKAVYLSPFKAENDLRLLDQLVDQDAINTAINTDDQGLRLQLARLTHLLARCETPQDAASVLWNRISLHAQPALKQRWDAAFGRPWLQATQPLPDLPPAALFRTLDGQRDTVRGLAFSPDGSQIVSTGDDRTVRLWYVDRGQQAQDPIAVAHEGRSASWSADGTLIAVGFRSGEVALYDPHAWIERQRWQAHDHQTRSVAIRPDGQQIASTSRDRSVKIWDRQGNLLRTMTVHNSSVEAVAYNRTGTLLATCEYGGLIMIWDAVTGEERQRLDLAPQHGYCIAFNPDGTQVAMGASGGRIVIWDLETNAQQVLTGHTGDVRGVAYSPRGGHLVSGASDRAVVLWRTDTWSIRATWADHLGIIRTVAWEPNGGYIASGSNDRAIKIWSWLTSIVSPPTAEGATLVPRGTYYSLAYAATLGLVALERSGRLFVIDPAGIKPTRTLAGFHNDSKFVTCSLRGNWVIGLNNTETIKRWEGQTGQRDRVLSAEAEAVLTTANYSPDETQIAVTSGTDVITLRDAESLAVLRTWQTPEGQVAHFAGFSPDGQTVIVGAADGNIWLWSLTTKAVQTWHEHRGPVHQISYTPDGRLLASVSSDRRLKIWDAASGKCLHTFHADGGLYSLAWYSDTELVAGGSRGLYFLKWLA